MNSITEKIKTFLEDRNQERYKEKFINKNIKRSTANDRCQFCGSRGAYRMGDDVYSADVCDKKKCQDQFYEILNKSHEDKKD